MLPCGSPSVESNVSAYERFLHYRFATPPEAVWLALMLIFSIAASATCHASDTPSRHFAFAYRYAGRDAAISLFATMLIFTFAAKRYFLQTRRPDTLVATAA